MSAASPSEFQIDVSLPISNPHRMAIDMTVALTTDGVPFVSTA